MPAAASVTAGFTLNSYPLTVTLGGNATGSVTSNPPGIDCGVDCTESYLATTPVVLTAVTAILGVLPIAFGINLDFVGREITHGAPATQWWISLSTAIVFGLGFATILTPVSYTHLTLPTSVTVKESGEAGS